MRLPWWFKLMVWLGGEASSVFGIKQIGPAPSNRGQTDAINTDSVSESERHVKHSA